MKSQKKSIILMTGVIIIMAANFMRLKDIDCIRPIHIVTMITLGAALGIILVNIISLIKNKKP